VPNPKKIRRKELKKTRKWPSVFCQSA
jgi:hypothetical protein